MKRKKKEAREFSRPEWAKVVSDLRKKGHLSQAMLGERLQCSAMSISRWERGVQEPTAGQYLQLGNLAEDPTCWYLWGRAGLRTSDVMRVLPALRRRMRESRLSHLAMADAGSGRKKDVNDKLALLPLLKVVAGSHGYKGDDVADFEQQAAETTIAAPRDWCPNPEHTLCLQVRGDSMMPTLQNGYIVAVDSRQTDRTKLYGQIVIMWHKKYGLSVSRLIRFDHTEVLMPDNRAYESVTLHGDKDWRIMGKVLWWIGRPS